MAQAASTPRIKASIADGLPLGSLALPPNTHARANADTTRNAAFQRTQEVTIYDGNGRYVPLWWLPLVLPLAWGGVQDGGQRSYFTMLHPSLVESSGLRGGVLRGRWCNVCMQHQLLGALRR